MAIIVGAAGREEEEIRGCCWLVQGVWRDEDRPSEHGGDQSLFAIHFYDLLISSTYNTGLI